MICLDTNYLIRALIPETNEARDIKEWLQSGEALGMAAIAWYEFLCGSTEEEERLASVLLTGGVVPFTRIEAQLTASGFCSLGKPRRLRVDAMIAATAIAAKAPLATNNRNDFAPFLAHGLELVRER